MPYSLPAGAAIAFLMLAVEISCGSLVPGLMGAAGLLIDYIMTVAVSIASGVAAITSAYPSMPPATLWIGLA